VGPHLNFALSTTALMTISHPDLEAGYLQAPCLVIVPYFQVLRVAQSQIIDPLSRWYLTIVFILRYGE
jgi:hypothetical protein